MSESTIQELWGLTEEICKLCRALYFSKQSPREREWMIDTLFDLHARFNILMVGED